MKFSFVVPRRRGNAVAKDLRSPKYRMRVVGSKKQYNRSKEKQKMIEELSYV